MVKHLIGIREDVRFVAVNVFRFECGEEIFLHGIIIRITFP